MKNKGLKVNKDRLRKFIPNNQTLNLKISKYFSTADLLKNPLFSTLNPFINISLLTNSSK